MSKFKLYDCDVGIKMNGVTYNFEHVREVTVEDPRRTNLTRGLNAEDSEGLAYEEGMNEPERFTVPIMEMPSDLKEALDNAFKNKIRCDLFIISRRNGSSKMAKSSLLANKPQQLTLNDTPESMDVILEFITFKSTEEYRD